MIVQTVSVRDKSGAPIAGLTAGDFLVSEDGKPQAIAFIEYQELDDTPLTSLTVDQTEPAIPGGVAPVTTPGVVVPPPGDARYLDRRLLVLYVDLHNMPFFDRLRVYDNARRYISTQMTAADMLAVMVFQHGRVRLVHDFTDNRVVLRQVVDGLVTVADEEERGAAAFDIGGAFGEDSATFNLFATDRQLAALQTAVTDLGPLPQMKTLIYLGSGLQLSGADNMAQLQATVNAAVRANVTINPIDTRGLMAIPPMGDASRASPGGIGMFTGQIAQAAATRQQQSQDTYYALAKDTGGRAMFDSNDLSLGIVQAAQAVTGYYVIGFYTQNPATDGWYRRVKIELRPGLSGELDYRPGIPMAMEVNYFQISSAEYFVPISIRMPGSELAGPRPAGDTRAVIDMIGEIKDEYGVTIRNARDKLDFRLDPGAAAQLTRRAIQYETGFSLLPGSYVIKVLARDQTTGRIGTFMTSFTVPNLEREKVRLPISTVVLTSQRTSADDSLFTVKQKIAASVANPLVHAGQKLIPGVTRTFSLRRPLHVFLQAYQRDSTTMRPVVAFVTLSQGGVKVLETALTEMSEGWDPRTRAVPIRFSLSLTQLPPGSYDCQVTVLDPTLSRAAFWRTPIVVVR